MNVTLDRILALLVINAERILSLEGELSAARRELGESLTALKVASMERDNLRARLDMEDEDADTAILDRAG